MLVAISNTEINTWKEVNQKKQLHRALIKAGFCPSLYLMKKLRISKEDREGTLIEKFYLAHYTEDVLLLHSTFYSITNAHILVLLPFGCKEITVRHDERKLFE